MIHITLVLRGITPIVLDRASIRACLALGSTRCRLGRRSCCIALRLERLLNCETRISCCGFLLLDEAHEVIEREMAARRNRAVGSSAARLPRLVALHLLRVEVFKPSLCVERSRVVRAEARLQNVQGCCSWLTLRPYASLSESAMARAW